MKQWVFYIMTEADSTYKPNKGNEKCKGADRFVPDFDNNGTDYSVCEHRKVHKAEFVRKVFNKPIYIVRLKSGELTELQEENVLYIQ